MHNPHSSSVDLNSQKPADFLIRHPLLQVVSLMTNTPFRALQPLTTGMVHSISLSESALIHSPEVFCYPITNLRLVSPSVTSSTTIINAVSSIARTLRCLELKFLEDFLLDQTLVAIFQAAPGLKEYTIIEKTFAYTASGRRMLYKLLESIFCVRVYQSTHSSDTDSDSTASYPTR